VYRGSVIISADDFGMTSGVNRAIRDLLESGRISSTAVLLGHPGSTEALDIAAAMPIADLGLHVNLTDGRSITQDRRLAALIGPDGRFLGRRRLAIAAAARTIDLDAVQAEVAAQIDLCQQRGLPLTHVDSHHYVHAIPGVGDAILGAAANAGVRATRARHRRSLTAPIAAALLGRTVDGQLPEGSDRSPVRAAAHFVIPFGAAPIGPLPMFALERLLRAVNGHSVEIVAHPGFADADLAACSTYVAGREREWRRLSSEDFAELLHVLGLRLTTIADAMRERRCGRPSPASASSGR
jgi:predicted glycoside hydrolase/deacetylase ChbG (UPF0249 family)